MKVTQAQMKKLIALAREQGLKRIRLGDFEAELLPVQAAAAEQGAIKTDLLSMPTDEDMLLWSAPGPLPSEEKQAIANDLVTEGLMANA